MAEFDEVLWFGHPPLWPVCPQTWSWPNRLSKVRLIAFTFHLRISH